MSITPLRSFCHPARFTMQPLSADRVSYSSTIRGFYPFYRLRKTTEHRDDIVNECLPGKIEYVDRVLGHRTPRELVSPLIADIGNRIDSSLFGQ